MLNWLKSLFASKSMISVSIPVATDFPNEQELSARNQIMAALDAMEIGEFIGAGGGFSQMDFEYEVVDVDVAKRQIAETIGKILPGQKYEITVE